MSDPNKQAIKAERRARLSQSLARVGDSASRSLERFYASSAQKARGLGSGVGWDKKLLAGICLPFTIVIAMAAAEVIDKVVVSLVPSSLGGGISFIQFLLGSALFVAAFGIQFVWVQTGGFGIFTKVRKARA